MKVVLLAAACFWGVITAADIASAQTWTPTSAPTNLWSGIACSADGTKLFACAGNPSALTIARSPICLSIDGGLNWTNTTAPSNFWTGVACSADGSHVVAIAGVPGGLYTSTDGGST